MQKWFRYYYNLSNQLFSTVSIRAKTYRINSFAHESIPNVLRKQRNLWSVINRNRSPWCKDRCNYHHDGMTTIFGAIPWGIYGRWTGYDYYEAGRVFRYKMF